MGLVIVHSSYLSLLEWDAIVDETFRLGCRVIPWIYVPIIVCGSRFAPTTKGLAFSLVAVGTA